MTISFRHRGNFDKIDKFLRRSLKKDYHSILEKYAKEGVAILSSATPKDSGLTADSWDYEIVVNKTGFSINWTNSNTEDGIPIVILLHYGHGTRSGSFVEGTDFINPSMRPLFDKIADDLWKEVTDP